jgi:hypothetical protein
MVIDSMVKIEEHIQKMNDIKNQINNATGKRKNDLLRCYHRMQKQLLECNMYLEKKVIR